MIRDSNPCLTTPRIFKKEQDVLRPFLASPQAAVRRFRLPPRISDRYKGGEAGQHACYVVYTVKNTSLTSQGTRLTLRTPPIEIALVCPSHMQL